MHISTIHENGVSVVNVVGKLNVETCGAFKKKVRTVIEDGASKVLLDVSGIQETDSNGLGALVSLLNTVRGRGGDLRLAGGFAPGVEEAFNLCGLSRVFVQYANVKEGTTNFDL